MKALVVDDEPPARRRLVRMLRDLEDDHFAVEEAESAEEAISVLRSSWPDVMFLDIRLSGLSGIELARSKVRLPPIVFTTAYAQHAVDAFEAEAVDYLLKPVRSERLLRAIERIKHQRALEDERTQLSTLLEHLDDPKPSPATTVLVTQGGLTRIFDVEQIGRFWARDKYTCFMVEGVEYLLEESLVSLEKRLGGSGLRRVHRGELINLGWVVAVRREGSLLDVHLKTGEVVRVSRRFARQLQAGLGLKGDGESG